MVKRSERSGQTSCRSGDAARYGDVYTMPVMEGDTSQEAASADTPATTAASDERARPLASFRLPAFAPDEADLWLLQVECAFDVAGIADPVTKFKLLVANLPTNVAAQVRDVIVSAPGDFDGLCTALRQRLAQSRASRLEALLRHQQLGDRSPSQLLRDMRGQLSTAGDSSVDSGLLRTLFLQRLPQSARAALSLLPEATPLAELAEAADRFLEASRPTGAVSAVGSGEVSVQVSERGWAWLVCGRRLFVWRYAQSSSEAASRRLALCRELTLPPSDLAHRAELVQVLGGSEVHVPSCLAVSPEGTLRFWPSVIYESSSTESNADLQGQECERLICLGDSSCLLATTTSTLVLVSWPGGALGCRRLAPPAGLLGGIGRRVSSLIWGAMQTAGAEEPLVSLRAAAPEEPDCIGHTVYVMTARHLQRWWVADAEHMDSQLDVERLARDAFRPAPLGKLKDLSDTLEFIHK
ncbi:Nuclear pore complex protein Nup133 [Amphibalanus amphitrite]|uniref:Nuclear pore complex protein Nup133 n=1 Tax=Amphibalanus amphitrite TaxID=1232801 RepID=A0A6A4VYS1_AMPAM|nr:Nuclear pore complex protein Nup133 [Amphibalanus amphitrite]